MKYNRDPLLIMVFILLGITLAGCGGGGGGGGGGVSTTSVSGTVTYAGEPEVGVTVELWRYSGSTAVVTSYSALTGSDGSFQINNVIPGNYYAAYTRDGSTYTSPEAANVQAVTIGGTNQFNITVVPPPDPPT